MEKIVIKNNGTASFTKLSTVGKVNADAWVTEVTGSYVRHSGRAASKLNPLKKSTFWISSAEGGQFNRRLDMIFSVCK